MSQQLLVQFFHEFFAQPVRHIPTFISSNETDLRRKLLAEEAAEADEAMELGENLQDIAKELADVLFVAYGAALHYGIDLERAFEEVALSNMSKLWDCDRCDGMDVLLDAESVKTGLIKCPDCDGGKVAKYRNDGKVLKPPTYQPPDLSFIPKKQKMATINEL